VSGRPVVAPAPAPGSGYDLAHGRGINGRERSIDEHAEAAPSAGMGAVVGAAVRRLREARKISAAALAREAGLSKATLSKLEAGQGNPTIETVSAIAVALRLPLVDLLSAPVEDVPTLQRLSAEPVESSQELLHRIAAGALSEIWRIRIRRLGYRIEGPAHSPGTVEHLIVTRGALRAGPSDNPRILHEGDFLIYAAATPHFYEAMEDRVDATLVMAYPATAWS
jgi:transcriptional regulator with XRE-family HTH domain